MNCVYKKCSCFRHFLIFCGVFGALQSSAFAAGASSAKTYQVTGPVIEITDSRLVIQKGDEKWEVGRDALTKINGTLKPGAKVTVQYRMMATSIEQKK